MRPGSNNRIRNRWVPVLTMALIALAACGGADASTATSAPDTSATSAPTTTATDPVTLRMGVTGGTFDAQAPELIDAVDRLSSSRLQIMHADEWDITGTDKEAEQKIIRAVASGDLDLGLVGTRALSDMGITDFEALIAPMLIDSYPLERAVLDSDIPSRMLPAVDQLGVTGLAVIGGGLRYPAGVDAPYLGPETYQGANFHVFSSQVGLATVAALGATPTNVIPEERDVGLADGTINGFENSMSFLAGKPAFARHVAINVPLWPATGILVASPETLAGLDQQHTEWLMGAVAEVEARSLEYQTPDQVSVETICDQGGAVYHATEEDLQALRAAVETVYDQLDSYPTTSTFISQIVDLKSSIESSPIPIPEGCGGSGSAEARLPDGNYQTEVLGIEDIVAALEARGIDQEVIDQITGSDLADLSYTITYKFEGNTFVQTESDGSREEVGSSGTYRIVDDTHLEFNEPCCGKSLLLFSLDGDTLTLHVEVPDEDVQNFCREAPFDCVGFIRVVEAAPFVRVNEAP